MKREWMDSWKKGTPQDFLQVGCAIQLNRQEKKGNFGCFKAYRGRKPVSCLNWERNAKSVKAILKKKA